MSAIYLEDFARELRQIGEVGFRRRYAAPVLIVMQRVSKGAPPEVAAGAATHATGLVRQSASLALIHRVFPLVKAADATAGPITVGRTTENDVVIPEYSISKRHCTFEVGDGALAIRDTGSTNGTLLNGNPLPAGAPTPLCGGEMITLGRFLFVYETPAGFLELVSTLVK